MQQQSKTTVYSILIELVNGPPSERPPTTVKVLAHVCGLSTATLAKRWIRDGLSATIGSPKSCVSWLTCRYICAQIETGSDRLSLALSLDVDERTVDRLVWRILGVRLVDLVRCDAARQHMRSVVDEHLRQVAAHLLGSCRTEWGRGGRASSGPSRAPLDPVGSV